MTRTTRPTGDLDRKISEYPGVSAQDSANWIRTIAQWPGEPAKKVVFLTLVGDETSGEPFEVDEKLRATARVFLARFVLPSLIQQLDRKKEEVDEALQAARACVEFYSTHRVHSQKNRHFPLDKRDRDILVQFLQKFYESQCLELREPANDQLREAWFKAVIYAKCFEHLRWHHLAAITFYRILLEEVPLINVGASRVDFQLNLGESGWSKADGLDLKIVKLMRSDLARMQIIGGLCRYQGLYDEGNAMVGLAALLAYETFKGSPQYLTDILTPFED